MRRNLEYQPGRQGGHEAGASGQFLFRLAGILGLGLAALLALLLLFDRGVMPLLTRQGQVERCPRVLGLTLAEAQASLRGAGFIPVLESQRPEPNGVYMAGQIMDQYPRPGRLTKSGRRVHLTLSTGGRGVQVPELTGYTQRQAESVLVNARLEHDTLRTSWRHDERYGQGTVLSQQPPAGEVLTPGSGVALIISLGPAPEWVSTPSLAGLSPDLVKRHLEQSGLVLGMSTGLESGSPPLVVDQEPAPGTPLAPGSIVDVWYVERSAP